VVLEDVAPHSTVAGVPARVVGREQAPKPALEMDHRLPDAKGDA
jgi:serine O-acetyltransferase